VIDTKLAERINQSLQKEKAFDAYQELPSVPVDGESFLKQKSLAART